MTVNEIAKALAPKVAYALIAYSALTIYTLDKKMVADQYERQETNALLESINTRLGELVAKDIRQDERLLHHDYAIEDLNKWRRSQEAKQK